MLANRTFLTSEMTNEYGQEYFFSLESRPGLAFDESLEELSANYQSLQQDAAMGPETEIMVRIHASDVANQAEKIRRKFTSPHASSLVSIIGQPPVSGSKLALEAYHIKSRQPVIKTMPDSGVLLAKHGSYSSLWMTSRATSRSSSCKQTSQVFDHLSKRLHDCGASLPDSLQRTWIYVRDIDNNYMDMVDVRRALFRSVGLDKDSHYVASTCIEGAGYDVNDLVTMDSLSVLGLQPGQVRHMSAEAHLCPTHNYGVTFERGTQIVYGDRSHYYISGTASIDKFGEVVHVGDVAGQSLRTLENIDALLSGYGSGLEDIKMLTVYLRDIADRKIVRDILTTSLPPHIPRIMVLGAVCRPAWLVEMEAVAAKPWKAAEFSRFC